MLNPKRYSVMRDAPEEVGVGLFPEGNPGEMQLSEADILQEMIRRANGVQDPVVTTAQVAQEPSQITSKPITAAEPTVTAPELDKGGYPDRIDPNDPIGSMAAASRARNYYIADSTHNAGNIGDFFSLASKAVAGIGNVRGKMAETAVPDYMAELKKTAAARAELMNNADDRYQKAMLSKELMGIKGKSTGEAGYKADESKSRAELNRAKALGYINEADYLKALQDPTSAATLMTRLYASGQGLTTSPDIPGSAIYPLIKPMAGTYNANSSFDAKMAQIETQKILAADKDRKDLEMQGNTIENQKTLAERKEQADKEAREAKIVADKAAQDAKIAADAAKTDKVTGTAKSIAEGRNKTALQVAREKAALAKKLAADKAAAMKAGGGKGSSPNKDIDALRKEYQRQKVVSDSYIVKSAHERLQHGINNPTAAGDIALLYGYMKILDPGSTVRESEFATAQNAGSIPERIWAKFNQAKSGQRLTESQRKDFAQSAKGTYQGQLKVLRDVNAKYKELAKSRGLAPKDLLLQGERKKIKLPSGFKGNRISYQGKAFSWNDTEKVYEGEE